MFDKNNQIPEILRSSKFPIQLQYYFSEIVRGIRTQKKVFSKQLLDTSTVPMRWWVFQGKHKQI